MGAVSTYGVRCGRPQHKKSTRIYTCEVKSDIDTCSAPSVLSECRAFIFYFLFSTCSQPAPCFGPCRIVLLSITSTTVKIGTLSHTPISRHEHDRPKRSYVYVHTELHIINACSLRCPVVLYAECLFLGCFLRRHPECELVYVSPSVPFLVFAETVASSSSWLFPTGGPQRLCVWGLTQGWCGGGRSCSHLPCEQQPIPHAPTRTHTARLTPPSLPLPTTTMAELVVLFCCAQRDRGESRPRN